MKNITYVLMAIAAIYSCKRTDNIKSRIEKDLNSRFTAFEILEIRPDSSSIDRIFNWERSLSIQVSKHNSDIAGILLDASRASSKKERREFYKRAIHLDSLIIEKFTKFESLQYDCTEKCYYVKYNCNWKDQKVTAEEYYLLKENEVLHRPVNWSDFMNSLKYQDLLDECLKYHSDVFDLQF